MAAIGASATAGAAPPPVRAAGGVVYRLDPHDSLGATARIAVVHRPRYDDWSLPKGKRRRAEPAVVAARREIGEETGLDAVIQAQLGRVRYQTTAGRKTVQYFAAAERPGTVLSGFAPDGEVDELRWLSASDAAALVSYPGDRKMLARFLELTPITATVVLIRHARAGKRDAWAGPDELRPLSAAGRKQAAALAGVLPCFAPQRVLSARPARCRQTVEPLADALGVAVEPAPWAGDEPYAQDPHSALQALVAIAGRGETVAVCSQGDALPGLLEQLAGPTADYETAKGAFWVLSFRNDRLITLDRYGAA